MAIAVRRKLSAAGRSRIGLMKLSKYVPQPGSEPLEPKWKDQFKDVMHPRQPTWKGDTSDG